MSMWSRRRSTVIGATILVLPNTTIRKRCRFCRARIVLARVAPRGAYEAFNDAPAFPGETQNQETRVRFELWPRDLLHYAQCRQRIAARSAKAARE